MTDSLFITGTDTGVGKTFVSVCLTRLTNCHYWKPVQTGTVDGSDVDFVRTWHDADKVHAEVYAFPRPASPHRAAPAGQPVHLSVCLRRFEVLPRPLVVEGAGGALVPLNSQQLMTDLMVTLGLPALVVTHCRLGSINQTLMTFEVLRSRGIPVVGVVVNNDLGDALAEDLVDAIDRFSAVPIIARIPRFERVDRTSLQTAQACFHIDPHRHGGLLELR